MREREREREREKEKEAVCGGSHVFSKKQDAVKSAAVVS